MGASPGMEGTDAGSPSSASGQMKEKPTLEGVFRKEGGENNEHLITLAEQQTKVVHRHVQLIKWYKGRKTQIL